MNARASQPKEFTGRHMITVMVLFFGVIISVNVTMAVFARTSWTGLVVKNSYVASQEFNEKAAEGRAQTALGWKGELAYSDGQLRYRLVDVSGSPVRVSAIKATFRHPTDESHDQSLKFEGAPDGGFVGLLGLGDGQWIMEILADAGLHAPYRDVRRVLVRDGVIK